MKKLILPSMAAVLALGGTVTALASENQKVPVTASVAPSASNTSADYQRLLARTGGVTSALTHIIVVRDEKAVDESTFDK
jgi:hypothetical protein